MVFACALCFLCQKSQFYSKMVALLNSAYFDSHLCYYSNGISRIDTRIVHLGYCSNKPIKTNG